jgi:hypothetical protein
MTATVRRATVAGLAALALAVTACSGDRPAGQPPDKADALKKEADVQKQMHDREAHNR